MTTLEELRRRVAAAQSVVGQVDDESREYGDRLSELVEGLNRRLQSQQEELDQVRREHEAARRENGELRDMLTTLLSAVEQGGGERLGHAMRDLFGRVSVPSEPEPVAEPDVDAELPEAPDEASFAAPGPTEDEPSEDEPADNAVASAPESAPAQERPIWDIAEPASVAAAAPSQAADDTAALPDRDGTEASGATGTTPELEALAADVAAAAAGRLPGGREDPADTGAGPQGQPEPRPADELAALASGFGRGQPSRPLTAVPESYRPSAPSDDSVQVRVHALGEPPLASSGDAQEGDAADGEEPAGEDTPVAGSHAAADGIEVRVPGSEETGRSRPFERIIQRMSLAAQSGAKKPEDD